MISWVKYTKTWNLCAVVARYVNIQWIIGLLFTSKCSPIYRSTENNSEDQRRSLKAEVRSHIWRHPYKHLLAAKLCTFISSLKKRQQGETSSFAFRNFKDVISAHFIWLVSLQKRQRSHDHNSIFLRQISAKHARGLNKRWLQFIEWAWCIGFKSKRRAIECFMF